MALLCKFFNFYWFFIGIGIWLTLVKYMHTYNTRYFDQEKVMLVSTTFLRLKRLNILQELIPSNIARGGWGKELFRPPFPLPPIKSFNFYEFAGFLLFNGFRNILKFPIKPNPIKPNTLNPFF